MGSEARPHAELSGRGIAHAMPESGTGAADFRLLADALPHLVWVCRPDGTLDYLNRRGRQYFDPAADLAHGPFLCGPASHPEDDAQVRSAWERAIATGDPLSFETRLRRHDGCFHWHLTRAQPVRDSNGTLTGWMGTSTDVHDAREANDCSAFLLALSTELAPMGNPQELLCAAMGRLRERLGAELVSLAELDEPQGEAVMLRQRASDPSQIEVASLPLRPFENLARRAREGQMTVMRNVRDQSRSPALYDRWFGLEGVGAVVSAPLLQGGALLALLSVVEAKPRDWSESDVTLVQRVADIVWPAFQKARADRAVEEALREVNQRKDEFLAMLGHELRNPLAPITSAVQILRVHAASHPEIEWARAVIDRQTRHLARLVDDLLDVSRIVRGQIILHCEEIDLADVVTHGIETSRPLIRSRNHRLHVQLPRAAVRLSGDLTRLAQVLANLLNNAAKYTDEGGDIWLDASREGSRAVLRVRDTGAGIAPTLLPRVFELFAQAERTLDRSQGGLGIGLTLVKLLVEMHGGSVEARSAGLGQGAEFIVRLPIGEAAASLESSGPEPAPTSQTKLARPPFAGATEAPTPPVREDDPANGAAPTSRDVGDVRDRQDPRAEAEGGADPERRADPRSRAEPENRGDAGPRGGAENRAEPGPRGGAENRAEPAPRSGVENRAEPAGQAEPGPRTDRGNGNPADQGGPDGHNGHSGRTNVGDSRQSDAGSRQGRPPGALRVLIVDDNVDAADSTAMLLSLDGYETHSVHSARAALEVASSISPDVVLLDIGLPEMDGYEVARRLRSLPQGAPTLIVALTGYGQPADRERANLAGFDEFLVKPVETAVLNRLLKSLPVH